MQGVPVGPRSTLPTTSMPRPPTVARPPAVQQGVYECHSSQCGFCTPGFVMSTLALLTDDPAPDERAIREGLSGNLCRCTGYESIVRGVQRAAELLAEGGS